MLPHRQRQHQSCHAADHVQAARCDAEEGVLNAFKVKLIDSEWAGAEGKAMYPLNMAPRPGRPGTPQPALASCFTSMAADCYVAF